MECKTALKKERRLYSAEDILEFEGALELLEMAEDRLRVIRNGR
jgi:hypothetical protein